MPDAPTDAAAGVRVVCPACSAAVPASVYAAHLRQLHRLYLVGTRPCPPAEAADALADELVRSAKPQAENQEVAWQSLALLALEEHGGRAPAFLAGRLAAALARVPERRRPAALDGLGRLLAGAASPAV